MGGGRLNFCLAVETYPEGYSRLAALLDIDAESGIYRRFGYLQSRVLLEKQDDLRLLEEKLNRLDSEYQKEGSRLLITREDINEAYAKPRKDLLEVIKVALQEYGTYDR